MKTYWFALVLASCIYFAGLVSPPHLMDDVDAAEALQAKNMLTSGDWVTQRLNGTLYVDKAPLKYWMTAGLYRLLGVHDWVARLPTALAAVALCWLVAVMAGSAEAGLCSAIVMATSIGLFLFTRTVIPDVILTLFVGLSLWCFLRAMESDRENPSWAMGMYAALAGAVLTKGFIGIVLPVGAALLYLAWTRQFSAWRRLYVWQGGLLVLAMAAPWHILASLRNPPAFDWTLHAGAHFEGKFRGFFWFYFINEQALRFLNQRWPRDYNTVPRLLFYGYHVIWFFPWSFYVPAACRLKATPVHQLAVCWIGVVMVFFTFSTTQEYYSMPMYPAAALLLGSAMAAGTRWLKWATIAAGAVCLATSLTLLGVLATVWRLPATGDIFSALLQHPKLYTLALGHIADLTLPAFAYLKLPLGMAAVALLGGGLAALCLTPARAYLGMALMLVLFFQAVRLALVAFDPYLSSYAVAEKLKQLPAGRVLICGKYNPLSSVFFYLRDGTMQNEPDLDILEYGSLAPGAPQIQLNDGELKSKWNSGKRTYLVAKIGRIAHVHEVLGLAPEHAIFRSGDKYLFANRP